MKVDDYRNENRKIEFLLRTIYLIRKHFPSSEFLYLVMFFLKYLGYILFSLSLNDEINSEQNKERIKLVTFFSRFLINGKNLSILNELYPIICLIGFIVLLFFLIIVAIGFLYMKKNYRLKVKINENRNFSVTGIDLNNQLLKKNLYGQKYFKIISYFYFVIVFFHQYILEYYLFGFLGHLLYLCGLFDENNNKINDNYESSVTGYFSNKSSSSVILLIINLLTIFIINALFIIFMNLNTSKCLFLQNGIAFSSNNVYLIVKIIILNLSPFYGFMLIFQIDQKKIFILIIYFIIILCYLLNELISFRKFSCIHNKLTYMCLFIETFGFISCIHELIIFFVKSNDSTFIFNLIKYVIELFDTIILINIYLFKQNQNNLINFAQNLFCNSYNELSYNDIYYYMETYLLYCKDKKNKYIQMFKLIKYHSSICDKSDCPGKKLISKRMLHSPFTEISLNEEENNGNKNYILIENNEEIGNKNIEKNNKTDLDYNTIDELKYTRTTSNQENKNKNTTNISEATFSERNKESRIKIESNKTIKNTNDLENNNNSRLENCISSNRNKIISPNETKGSTKSVQFKEFIQKKSSQNINNNNQEIINSTSPHSNSNNFIKLNSKNINKDSQKSLKSTNLFDFSKKESSVVHFSETIKPDEKKTFNSFSEIYMNPDEEHYNNNIHESRRLNDEQFQIIGEQEIANRINFLYKHKKYSILEEYVFIHLQYLLMIKQNYRLALYYVGKYSSSGLKFCFLSKYFLYEIKKYVYKNIFSGKNSCIVHDHYVNKYKEENLFIREFINYISLLNNLRNILFNACEIIISFFKFRKILHNPLLFQKYHSTKIYSLLKSSDILKSSIKKIFILLREYYKHKSQKLKSIELSYLICNFFYFINNKIIPQELLKYISPILTFKDYLYEELENEYHMFFIYQPLIISLTKKDTFKIAYLTNIFCERLGYNLSDLKNQDFHEKLFPANPEMTKEHELLIKQFLFHDKNSYKKAESFIVSKYNSLVSVRFQAKIFPAFINEFYIIANINLLNDEFYSELNKNDKKNNTKIINYSFLLSNTFDFLGITENFFEEFEFNQEMLHELGVNYCQFFCIDEDKLISQIIKEKRKNKNLKNFKELNLKLKDGNNAYSIFKTVPYENIFKLRDSKLLDDFFYPKSILKDKINKKKIIHKIPELMSIADENGLDFEWMQRLKNYKNRLISRNYIQNEKLNNIKEENEDDDSSTSLNDLSENYFDVIYYIHKIGNFNYYIANIHEVIKNDSGNETKIKNNNNDKIKNLKGEYDESSKFDSRNSIEEKENKIHASRTSSYNNKNFIINKNTFTKFSSFINNINNNNIKNDPNNYLVSNLKNNSNDSNNQLGLISIKNKTPTSKLSNFSIKQKFSFKKNSQLRRNVTTELNKGPESLYIVKNRKKRLTSFYTGEQNDNNINLGNLNGENNSKQFSFLNYNLPKNLQEINEEEENNKDKNNNVNKKNNESVGLKKKTLKIIDDENIPLLTGDKLNLQIKKLNKRNKIINWIIYFLFLISILAIIAKYIILCMGSSLAQSFLKTAICIEMLKIDLYVQAISSLVICLNDRTFTSKGKTQFMSSKKIETIIDDLTKLHNTIDIIYDNKKYKNIFKIYYQEFSIYNLNNDWDVKESKTNLLDEIRHLSYKLQVLSSGNYANKCKMNQIINFGEGKKDGEPNDYIKVFFYFYRNILFSFKPKFDELTDEIVLAIKNIMLHYDDNLIIINIYIFIIFVFLVLCSRFKSNLDSSFYEYLFMNYYHINKEELKLEQNIIFFQNVVTDFNSYNIYNFEFIKRNYIISTEDTDNYQNNGTTPSEKTTKNINQNNLNKKEKINNNSRNIGEEEDNKNEKNNNIDTNNMNARFISASIDNSSSLYFMNSTNNNSNNNINKIKKSKDDIREIIISNCQKSLPKSLNIFKYSFFIFFFLFEIIIILNEVEIIKKKHQWEYTTNLFMNIFERIPKLMELVISTCTSVINRNSVIHGDSFEEYIKNQRPYIKYFYDSSNTYGKDIITNFFNNSNFGNILLDIYAINENINKYLYNEKHKIFLETLKCENFLGDTGKFCINAAMGDVLSSKEVESVLDFYSEVIYSAGLCLNGGENINKSGVKLEIYYILQEITNKYIDFILDEKNDNLTKVQMFFNNTDIKRIINDMQIPLVYYFNAISKANVIDVEKKTSHVIMEEIFINSVIFVMNIGILIFVFIFININEKYKKSFSYYSEIKYN